MIPQYWFAGCCISKILRHIFYQSYVNGSKLTSALKRFGKEPITEDTLYRLGLVCQQKNCPKVRFRKKDDYRFGSPCRAWRTWMRRGGGIRRTLHAVQT